MGLSLNYEFSAPFETLATKLEAFLRDVETFGKSVGFSPTAVLNVPFDTKERREFARRLGGHFSFHSEGLKGVAIPQEGQVSDLDPMSGECRLIPEHGVVLVVTDERGTECSFGFFRFPREIVDIHGHLLAPTGFDKWVFRDFVNSTDPRYRQIVERFSAHGYTAQVRDEFA